MIEEPWQACRRDHNLEVSVKMDDPAELQEYFALVKTVAEFDQRLLTIKSWGVTLSLAALGFGFQYLSYGMFLVSAASSVAFWSLETAVKRHQMRYYPRMREIEVNRYERSPEGERRFSAPRMDWSWYRAGKLFRGELAEPDLPPERSGPDAWYGRAAFLPHVMLPHAITFVVAVVLFLLAAAGYISRFGLGSAGK
jgi:hypothetical protein